MDFVYRLSRVVHKLIFEPNKNLYGMMKSISKAADGTGGEKVYHTLEHWAKVLIYDCKDCGDCALVDVAYNCPMSKCPKNQRIRRLRRHASTAGARFIPTRKNASMSRPMPG